MGLSMTTQYGHKACPCYSASGFEPWSSHEKMSLQLQLSALWDLPCSGGWPRHREAYLSPRALASLPLPGVQKWGCTLSAVRGKVTITAEVFPSTLSSACRKPLRCGGVMQRRASPRLPCFWESPALTTTGLPRGWVPQLARHGSTWQPPALFTGIPGFCLFTSFS